MKNWFRKIEWNGIDWDGSAFIAWAASCIIVWALLFTLANGQMVEKAPAPPPPAKLTDSERIQYLENKTNLLIYQSQIFQIQNEMRRLAEERDAMMLKFRTKYKCEKCLLEEQTYTFVKGQTP